MNSIASFIQRINDPALRPVRGLFVASAAGCIMLLARIIHTGSFMHSYLLWNLYLAWIPLVIACYIQGAGFSKRNPGSYFLFFLWLLFFPNAPYIVTDFIHLDQSSGGLLLVDSVLIFTFAFTGLAAGWLSLYWIYKSLKSWFPAVLAKATMILSVLLSGYGVYIGRELRWNSWDVFTNTWSLLKDSLLHMNTKEALSMTVFFSILILAGYWVFVNLIDLKDEESIG